MIFIFNFFHLQFIFLLVLAAKTGSTKEENDIDFKLDAQTANLVSSLLKTSAERAAANAPIILNRDSQLFRQYQQQRLPRRAPRHNERSANLFREDVEIITPSPNDGRAGSTAYKPTTEAPSVIDNNNSENNINHVFEAVPLPSISIVDETNNNNAEEELVFEKPIASPMTAFEAVPVVKSQDEGVISLENQLLELNHGYEALKLPEPQHVSQLPPIDSDLISSPNEALGHPILNTYSLAGQFVRPKPNRPYPVGYQPEQPQNSESYHPHHPEPTSQPYFAENHYEQQQSSEHYVAESQPVPATKEHYHNYKPVLVKTSTPPKKEHYNNQPVVHSDLFYKAAPLVEHQTPAVVLYSETPSAPLVSSSEHYETPTPSSAHGQAHVVVAPGHGAVDSPSSVHHYSSLPVDDYSYNSQQQPEPVHPTVPIEPNIDYHTSAPSSEQQQYNTHYQVIPTPQSTTTTPKPPATKPYSPTPEVVYYNKPVNYKPAPEPNNIYEKPLHQTTKAPEVIYKEIKPYQHQQHFHPQDHHIEQNSFNPFGIFGSSSSPQNDQVGSSSYPRPSQSYDPKPSVIFKGKYILLFCILKIITILRFDFGNRL